MFGKSGGGQDEKNVYAGPPAPETGWSPSPAALRSFAAEIPVRHNHPAGNDNARLATQLAKSLRRLTWTCALCHCGSHHLQQYFVIDKEVRLCQQNLSVPLLKSYAEYRKT